MLINKPVLYGPLGCGLFCVQSPVQPAGDWQCRPSPATVEPVCNQQGGGGVTGPLHGHSGRHPARGPGAAVQLLQRYGQSVDRRQKVVSRVCDSLLPWGYFHISSRIYQHLFFSRVTVLGKVYDMATYDMATVVAANKQLMTGGLSQFLQG